MTDPRSELERLVATWRARAVAERASGREPAAIPGMRRAIGDGIAAVYDQHADQLSAILQRSPCPADGHDSQVTENAIPAVTENQRPPDDHD